MPKLAIYFSEPGVNDYPFNDPYLGRHFFEAYCWLSDRLKERGIETYVVRGDCYLGEGRFKSGWKLVDLESVEVNEEFAVDLIFNRDSKQTIPDIRDCRLLNDPDFDQLCVDKLETFKVFKEYSPRTGILADFAEYQSLVDGFVDQADDLIVLKRNFDCGGHGIYIKPANEVAEDLYDDWSGIIIQEFLDSSMGIPGLVEGMHDLRVNVVNGEPKIAFLRMPAEGKYLANLSQGGSSLELELDQVPEAVMELVDGVSDYVGQHYGSHLFSADFMNSQKGYKLIEINSRPGILSDAVVKNWRSFNGALVEMLADELLK